MKSEYLVYHNDFQLPGERFCGEGNYPEYVKTKFLKSLIPLVEDKYKEYFHNYNSEVINITSRETDEWLPLNMMVPPG